MITANIHDVNKVTAEACVSGCGRYAWLKMVIDGHDHIEVTMFMSEVNAKAYADAINAVKPGPVEQQKAA